MNLPRHMFYEAFAIVMACSNFEMCVCLCLCVYECMYERERTLAAYNCSAKINFGAFYKLTLLCVFIFLLEILKRDCSTHLIRGSAFF